ncbi:GmrSD restriction endonuclease domain-containing protein [Anaerosalibacter bizertensis]|uniref:GmrSD restriction endonuclease domain-containing protein n=1 Tax=Anaerosalibacter bizertensis TaxID=932217 RepID=UPI0035121271
MLPPTKGSIDEILNGQNQFIIPVYQRAYSWERKQCKQLWNDIVEMQKNSSYNHFIGSIVNVAERFAPTGIKKYTIIDGQQRITTLVLLLIALRDYLEEHEDVEFNIRPQIITDIYLKNVHGYDEEQYKLILSQGDKQNLINLIEGYIDRVDENSRLLHNYQYFYNNIAKNILSPDKIYESIGKLEIVNITLERERDNPQQIFESLNSTGMDLSQSDLIRNYVLMGLDPDTQKKIYIQYWSPMESMFHYENQSTLMDDFFRDYITSIEGQIPTKSLVYESFKKLYSDLSNDTVESICTDIYKSAKLYTNMHYAKGESSELNSLFKDIKSLKMNVAYPFLLNVYSDYKEKVISKEEFIEILEYSESYVFRRAVCNIPTNSLNKTFATLYGQLDKDNYLNSFKYILTNLDTYKVFPTDTMFYENFVSKDMYNTRTRMYLLSKLENFDNKAPIQVENFTIEHIMPQSKKLNEYWKNVLGEDWRIVQKDYLHTIGNLTLTAYNPEMSDRDFIDKLNIKGGFKESALRLNRYVVKQDTWNKDKIKERAEELYELALKIWKYPYLSNEELTYFEKDLDEEEKTIYSINSYSFSVFSKELYEKLNQNILNSFPDTRVEYTKNYIAYKYETNYCDIIPQQKGIKIYINMNFDEIDDPHKIGRDVTNIGTWGNGNMEILMDSVNQIPSILYIIGQSYDKQLN